MSPLDLRRMHSNGLIIWQQIIMWILNTAAMLRRSPVDRKSTANNTARIFSGAVMQKRMLQCRLLITGTANKKNTNTKRSMAATGTIPGIIHRWYGRIPGKWVWAWRFVLTGRLLWWLIIGRRGMLLDNCHIKNGPAEIAEIRRRKHWSIICDFCGRYP